MAVTYIEDMMAVAQRIIRYNTLLAHMYRIWEARLAECEGDKDRAELMVARETWQFFYLQIYGPMPGDPSPQWWSQIEGTRQQGSYEQPPPQTLFSQTQPPPQNLPPSPKTKVAPLNGASGASTSNSNTPVPPENQGSLGAQPYFLEFPAFITPPEDDNDYDTDRD